MLRIRQQTHLIGNALKFSPEGGTVQLQISMSDSDTILFTVSDQGVGMSPEVLAHLEQKQWQRGTGMGLFMARGFVELHGGRLWAESEGRGRGSRVSFTLPARPAIERDPEFNRALGELRHWRLMLSCLLAEVQTLSRSHYRFDSSARADFALLVQTELVQLQALLKRLGGDGL